MLLAVTSHPPPRAVRTPAEARTLLAPLFADANEEKIAVLFLSHAQAVLAVMEFAGRLDAAEVPLREIMLQALQLGADALLVAHNHPGGNAEPSAADLGASRTLADTARNLDMLLVDHLVFAGEEVVSLRELGLL